VKIAEVLQHSAVLVVLMAAHQPPLRCTVLAQGPATKPSLLRMALRGSPDRPPWLAGASAAVQVP